MEVASSGTPDGAPTAMTQVPVVDPEIVVQYLVDVLQVTIGALKSELEDTGSLLSQAKYNETASRCIRFASDSQVALYVQKDLVAAESANGTAEGEGMYIPCISVNRRPWAD
jgi:dynein heavy chain 1